MSKNETSSDSMLPTYPHEPVGSMPKKNENDKQSTRDRSVTRDKSKETDKNRRSRSPHNAKSKSPRRRSRSPKRQIRSPRRRIASPSRQNKETKSIREVDKHRSERNEKIEERNNSVPRNSSDKYRDSRRSHSDYDRQRRLVQTQDVDMSNYPVSSNTYRSERGRYSPERNPRHFSDGPSYSGLERKVAPQFESRAYNSREVVAEDVRELHFHSADRGDRDRSPATNLFTNSRGRYDRERNPREFAYPTSQNTELNTETHDEQFTSLHREIDHHSRVQAKYDTTTESKATADSDPIITRAISPTSRSRVVRGRERGRGRGRGRRFDTNNGNSLHQSNENMSSSKPQNLIRNNDDSRNITKPDEPVRPVRQLRPLEKNPRVEPEDILDMDIIILSEKQRAYGEKINERIRRQGITTRLYSLPQQMGLADLLESAMHRKLLYAITLLPQHEMHNSITLTILHGSNPQEHKNMPLEDALCLINVDYKEYEKNILQGFIRPRSIQTEIQQTQESINLPPLGPIVIPEASVNIQQLSDILSKFSPQELPKSEDLIKNSQELQTKIQDLLGPNAVIPHSPIPKNDPRIPFSPGHRFPNEIIAPAAQIPHLGQPNAQHNFIPLNQPFAHSAPNIPQNFSSHSFDPQMGQPLPEHSFPPRGPMYPDNHRFPRPLNFPSNPSFMRPRFPEPGFTRLPPPRPGYGYS